MLKDKGITGDTRSHGERAVVTIKGGDSGEGKREAKRRGEREEKMR